jgi:toxin ParE1/3/4
MKIVFTLKAKADLEELRIYLAPLNFRGLQNVVTAIESKILLISKNPFIGRLSSKDNVREIIEPKYGFLIPYCIEKETLFILRIYRNQRAPLDYENDI